MIDKLSAWLAAHPALVGTVLFLVVSALVNALTRLESPEAWERLKLEHPRVAAAIGLMRSLGVDPVRLARMARALVTARYPVSPIVPRDEETKK